MVGFMRRGIWRVENIKLVRRVNVYLVSNDSHPGHLCEVMGS